MHCFAPGKVYYTDKDLTKFCRLVYRDMKHEIIGFDARGDVKVFDFGLCKALSPSLKASDAKNGIPVDGYNLTWLTGKLYYDRHLNDSVALYLTRRFYAGLLMPIFSPVGLLPYMAPEVAKGNPYDYMCDVFSFAILFWDIFSLKPAFNGFTTHMYFERVVRGGERLPLPKKLKPWTKLMVTEGWDPNREKRPKMERVAALIRGNLNNVCEGDETVLRRRLSHSMGRNFSVNKSLCMTNLNE
jgi:serine/threonine protein kinase